MQYDHFLKDIVHTEFDFIPLNEYISAIDIPKLEKYPSVALDESARLPGREMGFCNTSRYFWSNFVIRPTGELGPLERLINFQELYPEVCSHLLHTINSHFSITLAPRCIHLMRSTANSYRHIDLPYRIGSINCFIKNAEIAVCNFYKSMDVNDPFDSLVTETGKSYLINTSVFHQVVHSEPGNRTFLSITIPGK